MTHSSQSISPLRQRMIDDMSLRKLKPGTQTAYLRAVVNLSLANCYFTSYINGLRITAIGKQYFFGAHERDLFPTY